jgi:hypothetical protein
MASRSLVSPQKNLRINEFQLLSVLRQLIDLKRYTPVVIQYNGR